MISVVIAGLAGRMGQQTLEAARQAEDVRVVAGTVRPGAAAPAGAIPVEERLEAALEHGGQVVVDFTTPAVCVDNARVCAARGVPFVTGTTGLEPAQRQALEEAAASIPVLHAPNMSVGVHLLTKLVREAAERLDEAYDVEIVEAHHRHKRDAPSGTALHLAEAVARVQGVDLGDVARYGREGIVGARPRREIGISAVRGGDVVGEHTVLFLGDGERLELTHKASSRAAFARGAVRAARWIVNQPPGLYGMEDVLR